MGILRSSSDGLSVFLFISVSPLLERLDWYFQFLAYQYRFVLTHFVLLFCPATCFSSTTCNCREVHYLGARQRCEGRSFFSVGRTNHLARCWHWSTFDVMVLCCGGVAAK